MLLLSIITALLLDTTATEAYLQGQYGQSTMPIVGTQTGGFRVQAHSVYDISAVSRVFGEAGYTWEQSANNAWVENADYDLLYPYLTCDTIGGGMRSEQYWFRGGYRWHQSHILWHLALQYRAVQSYRNVDPRPKNKVADLQVEGSVGYTDTQYAYSLLAQVGRYKQNNSISFYSELGNALVYHLVQTNEDYARFAGDFTATYYHGMTVRAAWQLQPFTQGWLAGAEYRYLTVSQELSSTTAIPITRLQTHTAGVQCGYATPVWRVWVSGAYAMRWGTQYLYGDVAGNYYSLLFTADNYREQQASLTVEGSYRVGLPIGFLFLSAAAEYQQRFPSALSATPANPYFDDLSTHLTASQAHAALSLQYAFPLRGRYMWFVQPQADFTYYTSHAHRWQVALLTGVRF